MDPQNMNQPPVPPQQPVQPTPTPPEVPMAPPASFQPQQPASQPQPFQPMAPAPTPAPYGGFAPQPTGSGPNKKLILGIIGGVVGLLVIIIVAVLAASSIGVSKSDYEDASEKMQSVKSSYNKLGTVYLGTSSTDAEVKNGIDTIKSAHDEFASKVDELGGLKAVKSDKDVNELYKAVLDKKPKFDKAVEATVEAYEKIYPAVKDFNSYSSDTADEISALKAKLEGIDGLKDDNNKQFVEKMATLLEKFSTLAKKVQAGRADYHKYDSQAVTDFYDTSTDIRNAVRDWQSNLNKMADDGELKDELNALDDKIYDKVTKD